MASNSKTMAKAIRAPQRNIEAAVGAAIVNNVKKMAMKKSKLVPKEVFLPRFGITMYYHEREATSTDGGGEVADKKNQPTVIFCHGISGTAEDFAPEINALNIPPHVRILVPEQIGHGRDIERARADPDNFKQPTSKSMLESTSEFLDEVKAGNNCNAFGVSLGGGVVYYLRNKRPDIIQRTVLVSPAIVACIDEELINGILDGTNRFFCFESREDVKLLFRDLSTGRDDTQRKKKDPVPKFFLEYIYRFSKSSAPEGHWMALLYSLLKNAGLTHSGTLGQAHGSIIKDINADEGGINPFSAVTDIDKESHRLVMWPNKDRIINYEKGRSFFEDSIRKEGDTASATRNTEFETVPDCGHVFHSDGRMIFSLIRPKVKDFLLNFTSIPS
mmetsp:Transcript_5313/g.12060  ORF Transcript_5313/g.12060 Transcript_5313/m.12060 type:complete len:388 (+) Transcript_5313:46-1209(+)